MIYTMEVELLTEAVFGSGNMVPGLVDLEVLHDEEGFPYMKGKTVKGKIKEEFAHALWCLTEGRKNIEDPLVKEFFGSPDMEGRAVLVFSDLCMDSRVKSLFSEKIREGEIEPWEILNAVTGIRNFTAVNYETGTAEKGSLRRVRVIRKGLRFYSRISTARDLNPQEELLLSAAVLSLKYLGTMETRGKGAVRCRLQKGELKLPEPGLKGEWKGLKDALSVL